MPRAASPLTLEYILLGLLSRQPMHGYSLYKEVCGFEGIAQVWHIKQSQLYALLDKLEKDGYLLANVLPNENRPPRKEYHLTPAGRSVFETWLNSPVHHGRDVRQEFLARLYFVLKEGQSQALSLIKKQFLACQEWKIQMEQQCSRLAPGSYEWVVLRYRLNQTEATIRWLEECRNEISKVPPA